MELNRPTRVPNGRTSENIFSETKIPNPKNYIEVGRTKPANPKLTNSNESREGTSKNKVEFDFTKSGNSNS